MKKIDGFINKYSLTKTLRFALLPVGETENNFNAKLLLEEDKKRAVEYEKVKEYIDRYHRDFIETVLSKVFFDELEDYADLYKKQSKQDCDIKLIEKLESDMRKTIEKAFISSPVYKKIFGSEMITEILPSFLTKREEIESVEMFWNFYTYFSGFNENRKNMYTSEAQTTAISYRCINENLPKFLDNTENFKIVLSQIPEKISELNDNFTGIYGVNVEDVFCTDYFSFVLTQSGIDKYNGIIGGYTCEDGTKVPGLNEYINLYNQEVSKQDKNKRLPLIKPLYKQILTKSSTISFIPEKFENDDEVINAVNEFYTGIVEKALLYIERIFKDFSNYNSNGIYVNSACVDVVSNALFGKWNVISDAWKSEYQKLHPVKSVKDEEKYFEKVKKEYDKIYSFSINELTRLGKTSMEATEYESVEDFYSKLVLNKISIITDTYTNAKLLLNNSYINSNDIKLSKNDIAIELIKNFLDSIKGLQHFLKSLLGTGKEENKDDVFYGEFLPVYENLSEIDRLYDKVRNYVTQKPYSKNKIKLNFENPQLLAGWDKNKESAYRTVLLRKKNNYYLAVMDKNNSKVFVDVAYNDENEYYEKITFKVIPNAAKYFSIKQIKPQNPPENIIKYLSKDFDKKTMTKNQLVELIKYVVEDFIPNYPHLKNEKGECYFNFRFKEYVEYNSWKEFCDDIDRQAYTLSFSKVSEKYINEMIKKGDLYLFQIYNKDFSEHSKGNKNLHTIYFEMLFDERNISDIVYQINGGAEIFYREATIKDKEKIVHPANFPINNKNPLNKKSQSLFEYDIIKDKRFTKRQFSLHLPILLNYKSQGKEYLNNEVRTAIKNSKENYVIGIDRGERNLLYICLINNKGEIVKQKSLNVIGNNDYHEKLDIREKERDSARKSWKTVENIKELKEGYLSQAVNEICQLVVEYDAIIAMEDLNFGFKKGRFKVEKQVYQKFENMLISKLNYLVDKKIDPVEKGGALRAYQLTNKVDGVNRARQNGIIFYVPAWLTSKIDPKTGFVNLLNLKYTSVVDAISLIDSIDDIRYDKSTDMFEFDIDYSNFKNCSSVYKKKWTIYSNGDRIINFKNIEKNSAWDNKTVVLTDEFKRLFEKYGISYTDNLKVKILSQKDKKFFEEFLRLLSYVLQMRNSSSSENIDYLISCVKDNKGEFFDSRIAPSFLPQDADANGAFNIARKALWAVNVLKSTADENLKQANLFIKNTDWLEFAQNE